MAMTTDQPIIELLQQRSKPLLSFEFFPPKTEMGMDKLKRTAEQLADVHPDFVTVTYGAGGSTQKRTLEVCELLRTAGLQPVMPHLTCIGASKDELRQTIEDMYGRGYRNIMALRGDPPRGESTFKPRTDGLSYASELVALIKESSSDICCGGAGYPEKHPEAASMPADIEALKKKIHAGASFITSQLFYDNRVFIEYVQQCRSAGITVPILPGLLPVISLDQATRMTAMCQSNLPEELVRALEEAGASGDRAEEVGVRWAVQQIKDLLGKGAPGVHLYILNRARAALDPALLACIRERTLLS